METKKYVFLSYSRKDSKFAMSIANDLKKQGFNVWVDRTHIPGGKHWDSHIEEALKNSYVVVLIVSPASAASDNVRDEVSFAQNINTHIIPAIYQETEIPLRWHRLQFIDINKNYKQGLNELIENIKNPSIKKTATVKSNKIKYIFIGLFLLLVALIFAFFYKTPDTAPPKDTQNNPVKEINYNQSTKLYKQNTVIIGSGNKDINITQE